MKITINPPSGCKPDEVKHELKELKSGYVDIAVYPNGVEVVITHINGRASVESSMPLIKIDDETYQVPD